MAEYKYPPEGTQAGTVIGPGSSTDNNVPRFNGTTGESLQGSTVFVSDTGDMTGVADLTTTGDLAIAGAVTGVTTLDMSGNLTVGGTAVVDGEITVFNGLANEMHVGDKLFDVSSSGCNEFDGITITGGGATFTVGAGHGQIVDHETNEFFELTWTAFTGQLPAISTGITHVYIDRTGALVLSSTLPTAEVRRDNIMLARVAAISNVVTGYTINCFASIAPGDSLEDLTSVIGAIRDRGVIISPNGANLSINRSAGSIFQAGVNFVNDFKDPNERAIPSATPLSSVLYFTSTAVVGGSATIVPTNYDNAGTVTAIGGSNNQATIQRVYQFTGSGLATAVQYGPTVYSTLAAAIQAIGNEEFTVNPNIQPNALLIAIICVTKGCTDLSDTSNARIFIASRYGEASVGAAGVSVSTFQNIYENSPEPELVTDSTHGAVVYRRGSAADTDTVFEVQNGAGTPTFTVDGNGLTSAASLDVSGNATIDGDLTVNGTTVTLNVANLNVEDKNIRVNYGGTDASAAGAGLSVEGTGAATLANLLYDSTLASKFKLGASTTEKEVVTVGDTQTLTGKTLTTPVIAQISNTGTLTLPTSTDTLVGRATTDVLTNKDIDGGTASNTSRITVPKDTYANLLALTRKEGTLLYATDLDTFFADDGSVLTAVGSGSGQGEKNYIENPSGAASTSGWTSVNDLDIARTTTAADLPREYTTGSGLKITADANTQSTADYVYYDFTLDDIDQDRTLVIKWSQKQTGSYVAGDLAVVITSQADRTTILHTPETTAIPAADGDFRTTVDVSSTATLSLVIRATTDMATNAGIVISDVVVGPGTIGQVPAVGNWQVYSPDVANFPETSVSGFWKQNTDSMEVYIRATASGAVTGIISVPLPTGYTIDTSKLPTTELNEGVLGTATANDSDTNYYTGVVRYNSTTSVRVLQDSAANYWNATVPFTWASGDVLTIRFTVPIAEWAGSGLSIGPGSEPEYAATPSASWAAGSSTTVYGQGGQVMGGALAGTTTQTVTWQYPIQAGDRIEIEGSRDGLTWVPMNGFQTTAGTVIPSLDSGAAAFSGVACYNVSATQTAVIFGRYISIANDDAPGTNWPASGNYWRVRKYRNGQLPFAKATATNSGLYKAGEAPGATNGATIAEGNVGQILSTSTSTAITTSAANMASLSLTPGVWVVSGGIRITADVNARYVLASISTVSNTNDTELARQGLVDFNTSAAVVTAHTMSRYINVSSTTPVYLVGLASSVSGLTLTNSFLQAVRIA